MASELVVTVVVVPLDGGVLDGAVHAFDLSVGPWVVWLGQPVLNFMECAGAIEGMATQYGGRTFAVFGQISELDAVVGQHGVDAVRHRLDQRVEKGRSGLRVGPFDELGKGKLRGPVDSNEEVELSFSSADFGDIDVKEADRVALEALLRRLVAVDLR